MKRRALAACTLGLAAGLLPALPASAAPSVNIVIAPTHGVPGADLDATVTVTDCTPDSVAITGSYIDINGEEATTPAVQATNQGSGTWTADLTVPADAARTSLSEEPVTFTATPDEACDPDAPQEQQELKRSALRQGGGMHAVVATGSASVVVDDLPAAVLSVDPGAVEAGSAFDYTITGCAGGVADFYLLDNDANDYDIPESSVTSQPDATSYNGTFTVPADAVTGDAGVFLECAQAGPADAALLITGDDSGEGGGAPVAVPVDDVATFTG